MLPRLEIIECENKEEEEDMETAEENEEEGEDDSIFGEGPSGENKENEGYHQSGAGDVIDVCGSGSELSMQFY
jgi:hypothetical protein